jgi:NAD-dependent DNA ligase
VDTQAIAAKTIGKTITMQNIYAGYCNFMYLLQETKIPYIYEKSQAPITDGKCSGMVVCFSGFRDTELEKKIISEGGRVVSSVTKKTTHLIVKDITTVSSKLNKAQFLGVRIVELADLSI